MVSAQIKQNREQDTLWADFKLFLLYFLMSHVVWLSRSIKIVLLSVLFLQEISHVSVHRELKQTKSEDISGQVLWGTVLWYEQRESKAHHCWRVESFFFFFLCLPSALFLPFPLPPLLNGAALLPALLQLWGSSQCQVLVACFHVYKLGDKLLSREWFYSELDNTVSLTLSVTPYSVLHVR